MFAMVSLFHGFREPVREMGYSAAKYRHLMFLENAYEPALRCAELLLKVVGKCSKFVFLTV